MSTQTTSSDAQVLANLNFHTILAQQTMNHQNWSRRIKQIWGQVKYRLQDVILEMTTDLEEENRNLLNFKSTKPEPIGPIMIDTRSELTRLHNIMKCRRLLRFPQLVEDLCEKLSETQTKEALNNPFIMANQLRARINADFQATANEHFAAITQSSEAKSLPPTVLTGSLERQFLDESNNIIPQEYYWKL